MDNTLTSISGRKYRVIKRISQGAQGIVWKAICESSGKTYAIKILNKLDPIESVELRKRLELIEAQVEHLPSVFVLPKDIITKPRLGYTMELVKEHRPLDSVLSERDVRNSLSSFPYKRRLQVCYRLAAAFRKLHTRGMYYADISWANVLVNTDTGSIRIIDNDNLDPTGEAKATILGTPLFIAPELVAHRKSNPDQYTDYHSLATLIYYLLVFDHPLIGDHVAADSQDNEELWLGDKALFVHNTNDRSNSSEYGGLYYNLPKLLQKQFQTAFIKGLSCPEERIPDGKWMRCIMQVLDEMIPCSKCGRKIFYHGLGQPLECIYCNHISVTRPLFLNFAHDGNVVRKALIPNATIRAHHWKWGAEFDMNQKHAIAKVLTHDHYGPVLMNTSNRLFYAEYDMETYVINPNNKIKLQNGLRIKFGPNSVEATVVEG